jgi:DNA-binding transcriptional LysR family regulator
MKGSHLYLEQLKVFVDLVETRSFSKAAARHYLTQSAVSQQVAFLERHFGKKLVERGRGRFALTEGGEAFVQACHNILREYQSVLDQLRSKPKELTGTVLIETVYSVGLHTMVPYMRGFMKAYPGVNVRLEYRHSQQIYDDLLKGSCHIGLVAYPRQHPSIDCLPFAEEKLAVLCSPEHEFAAKKKVSLKEFQGRRFIGFEQNIPTRRAIDRIFSENGVQVAVVQEFDNIETLKKAVEIDSAISILPEGTAEQERKGGSLVQIPLLEGPFTRTIAALTRHDAHLSRAAQAFLEFLAKKKK